VTGRKIVNLKKQKTKKRKRKNWCRKPEGIYNNNNNNRSLYFFFFFKDVASQLSSIYFASISFYCGAIFLLRSSALGEERREEPHKMGTPQKKKNIGPKKAKTERKGETDKTEREREGKHKMGVCWVCLFVYHFLLLLFFSFPFFLNCLERSNTCTHTHTHAHNERL
jgi:hypothetical protein